MIYELIRRDQAWKATPWLALLSAVVWACPPPVGQFGAFIAMMGLFSGMPHRRATRFEAALPIEARDLLLARTLSLMAMVWIPALSGAAGMVVVRGFSALAVKPLAVGALCTLMAAVAQTAWLKELAGPQWILYPPLFFIPVAGPLMEEHPVPLVPPLCALAGVGLFVWAWVAVPRSFRLSSTGLKAHRAAGQAKRPAPLAAFRWAPVWRSVCSWQYVFVVTMMGFQTLGGQWLLTPFWLLIVWQGSRAKTRWLWALPVGGRALLWTIIGPILAAHVLGYLASFGAHRHAPLPVSDPRVVVVTLGAILAWVMLAILFCVLVDWRGFARIPRAILNTVFLSLFAIWCLASFAALYFARHDAATWTRDALAQLGRTAPMGLPALIAAAAAVLIALYWAVEKVFSEPDFADKPRVSQPDAFA
jgi:hypothetical protein